MSWLTCVLSWPFSIASNSDFVCAFPFQNEKYALPSDTFIRFSIFISTSNVSLRFTDISSLTKIDLLRLDQVQLSQGFDYICSSCLWDVFSLDACTDFCMVGLEKNSFKGDMWEFGIKLDQENFYQRTSFARRHNKLIITKKSLNQLIRSFGEWIQILFLYRKEE